MAKIIDLRKGEKKKEPAMRQLPLGETRSRRSSPLRARRRRLRLAITAAVALVLAGAIYGIHTLSYLPQFNIQRIDVTGAERIEPSIIQNYIETQLRDDRFHYLSRTNIFVFPKEVLERGIVASFPRVKTAYISRSEPLSTSITVAIGERQNYAKWCVAPERCFSMDDGGYVFAESSPEDSYATPYQFSGDVGAAPIGKIYLDGRLEKVLEMLRIVQKESSLTPASIEHTEDADITIRFAEGFALKASYTSDAGELAKNLQLILNSEVLRGKQNDIDYIDLRFGNRVYYKLKSAPVVKAQ